jgi:hypothetical protein
VGFVVDKVVLGQALSQYSGFPCQSSFHQLLHNHHHLTSGASTTGQQWPQYQVDSVSPSKKNKYLNLLKQPVLETDSISVIRWKLYEIKHTVLESLEEVLSNQDNQFHPAVRSLGETLCLGQTQ